MDKAQLETIKQIYGGPLSEREVNALRDLQAYVDFCIENGLSFRTAIGTIAHDVNGILAPGDMFERGIFRPKIQGYRKIRSELATESAAMGNDPQLQKELGQE